MKLAPILALFASLAFAEDDVVLDPALGKPLDAAVQSDPAHPFWGAVLVAKGGKVLLARGYGDADYAGTANTPRTLFEIASTSKMFTATAVLKLEMQGKLAVADPLTKFFKNVPDDKKAITVQQLLSHTSGMTGEWGLPYQSTETSDEFVKQALAQPLASKTGTKWEYCNSAYALLGVIIEKASGKSMEEYIRENVFKPAGMKDSGFCQDKSLDAKRVTVRRDSRAGQDTGTAVDWGWSWGYKGMGGVVTTVYDLLRFDRAMRDGQVLDAATFKKQRTPVLQGYGLGCFASADASGRATVWHSGSVSGYLSIFIRYPEDDAVVIVLTNDAGDPYGVSQRLTDKLFPPPTATVEIDLKGQKTNEFGAIELPKGASWKAVKSGDDVVLSLAVKDATPAKITLGKDVASSLLRQVEESIDARKKAGEKDDGSLEGGIYTGGIALEDGKATLKGVVFQLQPSYAGVDSDGKDVSDPRMVLVLVDPATGQWPVMTHLSLTAAGQLAKELKGALAK